MCFFNKNVALIYSLQPAKWVGWGNWYISRPFLPGPSTPYFLYQKNASSCVQQVEWSPRAMRTRHLGH